MLPRLHDNKAVLFTAYLLLLVAIYLLHLLLFFGIGGRDDSYITYWSAYALSHFGEIVNYNGDRIEQSSSLLHVLVLALLHKTSSVSLPVLGVLFSLTCGLAAALLAGRLANQLGLRWPRLVPLAVVCTPYFTYWSSSGMEASFVALIIVWFALSLEHYLREATAMKDAANISCALLAYIAVKPESFFILAVFFFLLLVAALAVMSFPSADARQRMIQKILLLSAIATLIFAALCSWRYHYFGQIFPQPVYAKTDIATISTRLIPGLKYIAYSNPSFLLLMLLSVAALVSSLRRRKPPEACGSPLLLVFVIAYLCFVIGSGGDWMEARRLLVPVIPLLAICVFSLPFSRHITLAIACLFFGMSVFDSWSLRNSDSIGLTPQQAHDLLQASGFTDDAGHAMSVMDFSAIETLNYSHLRDMLTLPAFDRLLDQRAQQQTTPVVIASRQMGMIPFYLSTRYYKKIRFIDLRGLTTHDVTRCNFLSRSKPHSSSGLLMTSQFFLENQGEIDQACTLPRVDVLYDTGFIQNSAESTRAALMQAGYDAYYLQHAESSTIFAQYIAVRKQE